MIQHTVLLRFRDSTTLAQIDAARAGLLALEGTIPEVRGVAFGPNLAPSREEWPWVLVVRCDDMAAVERYLAHPAHVDVVNRLLVPIREARLAVDVDA